MIEKCYNWSLYAKPYFQAECPYCEFWNSLPSWSSAGDIVECTCCDLKFELAEPNKPPKKPKVILRKQGKRRKKVKYEDIEPDPITGKKPTKKQFEIIKKFDFFQKRKSQEEIGKFLGVSEKTIGDIFKRFKERCPFYYRTFLWIQKATNKQKPQRWRDMDIDEREIKEKF